MVRRSYSGGEGTEERVGMHLLASGRLAGGPSDPLKGDTWQRIRSLRRGSGVGCKGESHSTEQRDVSKLGEGRSTYVQP